MDSEPAVGTTENNNTAVESRNTTIGHSGQGMITAKKGGDAMDSCVPFNPSFQFYIKRRLQNNGQQKKKNVVLPSINQVQKGLTARHHLLGNNSLQNSVDFNLTR